MSGQRVLFLNARQAESGTVAGIALPRDYVLACRFLRCGIFDRTRSLAQGFDVAVLDPLPAHPAPGEDAPTFAQLCDARGDELVAEARREDREIGVLWSGGIDSTCALIATIKAATAQGEIGRVRVLLSMSSIHEYPGFFLRHIDGRVAVQPVSHPIAAYLDPGTLNVTGEHGDQLFGSHLLQSYVRRGVAQAGYREILPLVLLERLRNPLSARRVGRYLEPVIGAAPVPIRSLFDCMWWLNFTLKWQEVSLRLAVFRGEETRAVADSLRHFFRDERFQRWALGHTPGRPVTAWTGYKEVAKRYILEFTGDDRYFRTKEKEDSLRNVIADPASPVEHRVFMRDDYRPVVEHAAWSPGHPPLTLGRAVAALTGTRMARAISTAFPARRGADGRGA